MAYQARGRDPLLDSNMQAAIEKRGKELVGLALLAVGVLTAAMLWSYSPEDPNWMAVTDEPVQNMLGRFGASVAAPLLMIVGKGAWAISFIFIAWGLRFALHRGEERALSRLIFFPIAIAIGSIYAATLTPPATWTHSFGVGGLFGDTVLSMLLSILPFGAGFTVKFVSFATGVGVLALGAFVLGFTRPELRAPRYGAGLGDGLCADHDPDGQRGRWRRWSGAPHARSPGCPQSTLGRRTGDAARCCNL